VGFIGVGDYNTKEHKKAHIKWQSMLGRCYYDVYQDNKKSYIGCSVDERWHNFQVFAEWFYTKYDPDVMQDWDLDKDLLSGESKVYSPDVCCLIPKEINTLAKKVRKPVRYGNKFKAIYCKKYLGLFETYNEAEKIINLSKDEKLKMLIDKYEKHLDLIILDQLENNSK
jgi:hypothetical protein